MSANLLQTFQSAVEYFNALPTGSNCNNLVGLLHDDVVMKKVDDAKFSAMVLGKGAVKGYLNGQCKKDNPQFTYGVKPSSVINGSVGLIWGPATYQDQKAVPATINIEYSFAFKSVGGNWLILLMWASPV